MHPVLKHILARKGKSVPVNDGRKIALVLFGGIMSGVRGGGALIGLEELGLRYAFDSVYVISAGFPNIAYFLDNKIRLATSIYYNDLSGRQFIHPWRLRKVADIDYLMSIFKTGLKRLEMGNVLSLATQVYVGTMNVTKKRIEYLEIHTLAPEKAFDLLHASISIPYFHPGTMEIRGNHYKDVGRSLLNSRARLHAKTALASDATDILFIYNRRDQHMMNIPPSDRVFEILPPNNSLGLFETRTEVLKSAAQQMGNLVKRTFGSNVPIKLSPF